MVFLRAPLADQLLWLSNFILGNQARGHRPPARQKVSTLGIESIFPEFMAQTVHGLGVQLGDAGFGVAHDFPDFLHGELFVII
jgi:hypothetical protein